MRQLAKKAQTDRTSVTNTPNIPSQYGSTQTITTTAVSISTTTQSVCVASSSTPILSVSRFKPEYLNFNACHAFQSRCGGRMPMQSARGSCFAAQLSETPADPDTPHLDMRYPDWLIQDRYPELWERLYVLAVRRRGTEPRSQLACPYNGTRQLYDFLRSIERSGNCKWTYRASLHCDLADMVGSHNKKKKKYFTLS